MGYPSLYRGNEAGLPKATQTWKDALHLSEGGSDKLARGLLSAKHSSGWQQDVLPIFLADGWNIDDGQAILCRYIDVRTKLLSCRTLADVHNICFQPSLPRPSPTSAIVGVVADAIALHDADGKTMAHLAFCIGGTVASS